MPMCFNPRPRARATCWGAGTLRAISIVSIHALARGRPMRRRGYIAAKVSFNPRPRARATHRLHSRQRRAQTFQSTPSREGDQCRSGSVPCLRHVSIHALARGRPPRGSRWRAGPTFQSTPSREGDPTTPSAHRTPMKGFNPRPRARATRWIANPPYLARRFNPRPRARATNPA